MPELTDARAWRTFLHAALVSAVVMWLLAGHEARADESLSPLECAQRAEKAERLRDEGKLLASRELLVQCAQQVCPAAVRNMCLPWLADVDRRTPTLLFAAQDAGGRDLRSTRFFVDDREVTDVTRGLALPFDPGTHEIRAERPGSTMRSEQVVVREGEKNRLVAFVLAPIDAPPAKPPAIESPVPVARRPIPVGTFILGGVSLVAFGVATYTGIKGVTQYDELEGRCGKDCTSEEVDSVSTKFLITDVALGVGVAAAVGAVLVYLFRPKAELRATLSSFTF